MSIFGLKLEKRSWEKPSIRKVIFRQHWGHTEQCTTAQAHKHSNSWKSSIATHAPAGELHRSQVLQMQLDSKPTNSYLSNLSVRFSYNRIQRRTSAIEEIERTEIHCRYRFENAFDVKSKNVTFSLWSVSNTVSKSKIVLNISICCKLILKVPESMRPKVIRIFSTSPKFSNSMQWINPKAIAKMKFHERRNMREREGMRGTNQWIFVRIFSFIWRVNYSQMLGTAFERWRVGKEASRCGCHSARAQQCKAFK